MKITVRVDEFFDKKCNRSRLAVSSLIGKKKETSCRVFVLPDGEISYVECRRQKLGLLLSCAFRGRL